MSMKQLNISQEQLQELLKSQQKGVREVPMDPRDPAHKTGVNLVGLDGKAQPFMVQTRDCVDESHLHKNIAENLKLIDDWVEICRPSKGRVLVVSAGPSTLENLDLVRKEQAAGSLIVCVKHSLPMLVDNGIIPDACVILDPRDIEGTSTHNIKRTELFKRVPKETVFLIASMTNPSVTKFLQKKRAKIKGWHAEVAGVKENFKFSARWSVIGGSCSAMRAITLFKILGYSDFGLLGFDCYFNEIPKDFGAKLADGRPKYMQIEVEGKKYTTSGELIALLQDLERLFGFKMLDFNLEIFGEGPAMDIYKKTYNKKPDYKEMLLKQTESWQT